MILFDLRSDVRNRRVQQQLTTNVRRNTIGDVIQIGERAMWRVLLPMLDRQPISYPLPSAIPRVSLPLLGEHPEYVFSWQPGMPDGGSPKLSKR